MLGSQVLEVAIGLALVFFVLALASSAVTEIVSQAMSKRSKDLKKATGRIVAGQSDELTKSLPPSLKMPVEKIHANTKGDLNRVRAKRLHGHDRERARIDPRRA